MTSGWTPPDACPEIAATGHAAATLAARETDEEAPRMAEWQEHAVDPRDHRNER